MSYIDSFLKKLKKYLITYKIGSKKWSDRMNGSFLAVFTVFKQDKGTPWTFVKCQVKVYNTLNFFFYILNIFCTINFQINIPQN